jgi:hypothetical protein
MSRVARLTHMTEGQAYTVVIGLVLGLLTAVFGIPPAMRDKVTRVARSAIAPLAAPAPAQASPAPPASGGAPPSDFPAATSFSEANAVAPSSDAGSLAAEAPPPPTSSGPTALGAGAPTRQGWWTSLNFLRPNIPVALPVAFPPDVPEDGLYVAGGSPTPQAYSALLYQVPEGLTLTTLTLHIASGSFSSPAAELVACPIQPESVNFAPVQGGDTAAGPHYDCSRSAKGTANPTANTFTFDVRSLITGNQLAVAIVPTLPSDRVVLARPGDGSLAGAS